MVPVTAISIGDMNGIGPEVILKTLKETEKSGSFTPVILGSSSIIDFYLETLDFELNYHSIQKIEQAVENKVNILECVDASRSEIRPGKIKREAGGYAMKAIETGIDLCLAGSAHALVTAPISKEAIQKAGYPYPGHTEFLAEKTHCDRFMMMLVNDDLRVGLVTIHIPVSQVSENITQEAILEKLDIMNRSLKKDFGIEYPEIAILGLNPHAGDGGVIGFEENEIIKPSIDRALLQNINVAGPYPADGFFGNRMYQQFDAVLSMYHDQGLVAFKALSFNAGVNFTAGLPIIRTSPDHGTAFSIAGQNMANHQSFRKALLLAVEMANKKEFTSFPG